MREEYKNILDEMVINKDVINQSTDGRKLLMYLQVHKVLSYQDTEELYQMGPTKSIQHLMKIVLQSRNDEDMIHFLNSLEQAKYNDAYMWLKLKITSTSTSLWSNINNEKIIFKEDNSLKTSWGNLKIHYEEYLEIVDYWRQFGVNGILSMDTFYNHNIVISNENKQIQMKIENFDDMFSTRFKRIIVMAEAGYGKSTFVHEMARQWVKGDKDWTRKFSFLFLFHLMEVNENESKSLKNLLTACLCPHDASIVHKWLKCGNMSKAHFIFDGLDKLRQNFCQEVNELIFGGKVNLATVVITSRQCQKLEDLKKNVQPKLYIELKGYSNEGVIQQLKKFSIPIDKIKRDIRTLLTTPSFNTIYCITHSESRLACTNICLLIHSFVNLVIKHYRNSNQSFTISCKEELLLTLGQAAQNKFSFIQNIEIPYPNISRDHILWAVNSGLLHNNSLIEDLVFAHKTVAEYCAAYFWCKTSHLAIKKCLQFPFHGIGSNYILLNVPLNAEIDYLKPFTQFVCYLCPEFKEDLWRKFDYFVPIFDEYENLPDILCTRKSLNFSSHSADDQITIMNKLRFQENSKLELSDVQFESKKLFKTIRKLKYLHLKLCTFNIGPEEFFNNFTNVQSLIFFKCKFYDLNIVSDDPEVDESNPPHLPHLPLQEVTIHNCSVGIETFLSFIMKHSTFMKSFHLEMSSFNDCGSGWISELKNNKRLCISIEKFHLEVTSKLTKLEANTLAHFLEVGLFGLKYIVLHIEMENQEDYELILKNLSNLSALTSLCLRKKPFTTATLNYLADIFNKLKLKECGLEYQEIFFEERIIISITSCLSLENITFYMKEMKDSNYELFKARIENKNRQLRIIKRDYIWY